MPLIAVFWVLAFLPSQAQSAFETTAKQAILIDFQTGMVLYAKNPDQPMVPSSMSKMMTVYMVFERLRDGRLSLDDRFPVSIKAWKKGGSKMFVRESTKVRVEDLLRGIIVQSGNDASIVVAEGISGSESLFATQMTDKAGQIGLKNTIFKNATGWPEPGHLTTARDLAHLVIRTIQDFPEYYHYYAEETFTYSGIKQGNRNPLLYSGVGGDGLKTGHTEDGGYGLAASSLKEGRRLVLVINGLESSKERAEEAQRLMNWGFREFTNYPLFVAGETVTEAPVWLGNHPRVPIMIDQPVILSLSPASHRDMRVEVIYDQPIPAPVRKGQTVAMMKISIPEQENFQFPLKAGRDIEQLGPFGKIGAVFNYFLWGHDE